MSPKSVWSVGRDQQRCSICTGREVSEMHPNGGDDCGSVDFTERLCKKARWRVWLCMHSSAQTLERMESFVFFCTHNLLTSRNEGFKIEVEFVFVCVCPAVFLVFFVRTPSPFSLSHPSHCFPVMEGKYLTQLLLISLVVHNSVSLCPVNEDTDVIEWLPPLISSLSLSPLCFVYCWHFPSEPGFNAVAALSLLLRNHAVVMLRCILHLLFPRRDGHCGKQWPRKLTFISVFYKDFPHCLQSSTPQRRASLDLLDLCSSRRKNWKLLQTHNLKL